MPTKCLIEFENCPSKVIYSGQLLLGRVHLTLTQTKKVHGIFVRIKGKAFAHWDDGPDSTTYVGDQVYLDKQIYLIGGKNDEVQLLSGSYDYAFEIMLPHELPTSIEGQFGHIRYTVYVVLDIPFRPNKVFKEPFTVIKAINLNADPAMRQPVIAMEDKTFNSFCLLCCCPSKSFYITAHTPVGGYISGQTIDLYMNIDNESNQSVSKFTVQLIKQITYHDRPESKAKKVEIIVVTKEETLGCDSDHVEDIQAKIIVPSIPPTDNTINNIIKVEYFIRIIGSVAGCHINPVAKLPIVIGSYPFSDNSPFVPNNGMTSDTLPGLTSIPE